MPGWRPGSIDRDDQRHTELQLPLDRAACHPADAAVLRRRGGHHPDHPAGGQQPRCVARRRWCHRGDDPARGVVRRHPERLDREPHRRADRDDLRGAALDYRARHRPRGRDSLATRPRHLRDRPLHRRLRPGQARVHDKLCTAGIPGTGAVDPRRHLPTRLLHRAVHRRGGDPSHRLDAIGILGAYRRLRRRRSAVDRAARPYRSPGWATHSRLQTDRRRACRRRVHWSLPHHLVESSSARAARNRRRSHRGHEGEPPGDSAALGCEHRYSGCPDRPDHRSRGRARLRPLLRERPDHGSVRATVERAAVDDRTRNGAPRARDHARPHLRGAVVYRRGGLHVGSERPG